MRDAAAFFAMLSSIFLSTPTFVVVVVAVCGRCWRAFDARENDDDVSRDGDTIVFVVVVDDDDDVVFLGVPREKGQHLCQHLKTCTTTKRTPTGGVNETAKRGRTTTRTTRTTTTRISRGFAASSSSISGDEDEDDIEDDEDDEGECRTTFDGKATVE